jgi:2-oxo-3-hexenedioate decarboxylase
MQEDQIQYFAQTLTQARQDSKPIEQFGKEQTDFSEMDAYHIQELGIGHRLERGEKLVGLKMGLTSEAKRKQMDLHSPLYGELTDQMQIPAGAVYSLQGQIHPKIEPEIAFLIGKELKGAISVDQAKDACESVFPAMEILDSRYTEFKYFSLEEVISDNSSSSQFVLGAPIADFHNLDLAQVKIEMIINQGEQVLQGFGKAISGDPWVSVVQLSELLARRGRSIPAGSIILAGAATAAVPLQAGMQIDLKIEGFKPFGIQVSES